MANRLKKSRVKTKPKSKSSAKKAGQGVVRLIPPTKPEARDEGPRLIPWDAKPKHEQTRLEYLTDLADIALGKRKRP
jgi:hypothetical protein